MDTGQQLVSAAGESLAAASISVFLKTVGQDKREMDVDNRVCPRAVDQEALVITKKSSIVCFEVLEASWTPQTPDMLTHHAGSPTL